MIVNAPVNMLAAINDSFANTVALVSTRIWAERDTPVPDYTPSDGPAICFKARDDQYDEEDAVIWVSYQFKFYGLTEMTAYDLYRAFRAEAIPYQGPSVMNIVKEGGGQSLLEPETEWFYVLAFFGVMFLNQ
ncbi:MAG TPA: hypothetical protein VGD99_11295 [Anaerolineae bacterium]